LHKNFVRLDAALGSLVKQRIDLLAGDSNRSAR
jgi:hypothetical protein